MKVSGIFVTGLMVKFGSVVALNGCSVKLPGCGLVSLIGENGSGKSTLLDVLSGFVPASGGLLTDGSNRRIKRSQLLDAAARVHQRVVLPEGVRVYEYMAICERPRLAASPFTSKAFLEDFNLPASAALGKLVRLAGITDLTVRVDRLSWGQRRIVSICGALMTPKPVILLDEPFAGIVNSLGATLMQVIAEEARERLVIFAEHDLEYAMQADRVVVLKQGTVVGDFIRGELPRASFMQYFGD